MSNALRQADGTRLFCKSLRRVLFVGSSRFKGCVLSVEELRTPDGLDEFRKALEALLAASGCHGLSQCLSTMIMLHLVFDYGIAKGVGISFASVCAGAAKVGTRQSLSCGKLKWFSVQR